MSINTINVTLKMYNVQKLGSMEKRGAKKETR